MENIINNEVVRFTSELCRGGDISDLLGMRSDHGHPQPRHRRPPPVRNDSGKVGLLFGDVHPGQPPLPDRADNGQCLLVRLILNDHLQPSFITGVNM